MQKYLSTDELLVLLQKDVGKEILAINHEEYVPIPKIKGKYRFIYWILLGIAILHVLWISTLLILPNNGLNFFGSAAFMAVPYDEPIVDNKVIATISIISEVNYDQLNTQDNIAFYGRYGEDILVVETIVSIDRTQEIVITTSDGFIESNQVDFEDIVGVFERRAHLGEIIIFVSTSLRGFIILVGSYLLLFGVIYYFYMGKKKEEPVA